MSADRIKFADVLAMQASSFADQCMSCGACLEACPVFPMTEAVKNAEDLDHILSEASGRIAASGLSVDELKRVLPVYVEPFRSK